MKWEQQNADYDMTDVLMDSSVEMHIMMNLFK